MKTATALLIVSLFVFAGCAQQSRRHDLIPSSPSDTLLNKLHHQYPDRFRLHHRVILTVREKNYDFNGYLTREGDRISALGFNDLGGRLFHMTSSPQNVEILSKPERMPAIVLRSCVAPELNAVFSAAIFQDRFVSNKNNKIVLIHGRRNIEYLFNPHLQRCHTIIISEDGERISLIELRDYRIFPGWNQEMPETIKVSNRKWNYEMTLRLLQIKLS